jgi:copper transport protein
MANTVPGNYRGPAADRTCIMVGMHPARIARLAAAGGLFGLLMVLMLPAPAQAHATLVGSDPPDGTILNEPPSQVVLSFSEPVRLLDDRIQVIKPDGQPVEVGDASASGTDVTIPVAEEFDIGTYLVSFRVISQDSHPVAGALTYSVGAPSDPPELVVDEDVVDPAVSAALSINKYIGYAGLVLLVGPAVMLATLWPRRLSRTGPTRLIWTGVGLVAVSTLIGLWLQVPHGSGGGLFEGSAAELREVLASPYGTAHIVRLGVLLSISLLLRPLLAGRASRSDLVLLVGLGIVGLGTWPVAGHPVASPIPIVTVVLGTAHVAAAAVWIGGLVVLAGMLLRKANEAELGVILPEWSRWAANAVIVLIFAGLVQAVVEIGVPNALFDTSYGRLLLVKLGLVAVVIAVAGYSRRLVRSRLGPSRPRAMRMAVGIEAAVLAGVLAMSSVLVQTTPGRTEAEAAELAAAATTDFVATLDSELYSLEVIVEPAERGSNAVHLTAYTPDGAPQPVEEWRVTAELPASGVEPIEAQILPLTDNHATGEVALPTPGDWLFRFTLRTSEIDQATVEATVTIR